VLDLAGGEVVVAESGAAEIERCVGPRLGGSIPGELGELEPEVRDWEPRAALDGGPEGLAFYPYIAALASNVLKPGGGVYVEIGEEQVPAVAGIFDSFTDVTIKPDLAGRARYVTARQPH
jgi:release factor glutamine methyltransferase